MRISPDLKTRLKAARRVLFEHGKDRFICSFCGMSRFDGRGNIIAGPGVAICASCARMATAWNLVDYFPKTDDTEVVSFELFYQHQLCLLEDSRTHLDRDLRRCSTLLGVELVGWNYGWAQGDFTDSLTIYVRLVKTINCPIFYETFAQAYLRLGNAEADSQGLRSPWPSQPL